MGKFWGHQSRASWLFLDFNRAKGFPSMGGADEGLRSSTASKALEGGQRRERAHSASKDVRYALSARLRNASDADRSNWREVIAALGGVAAVKKEEVTCFVKWH